MNFELKKKLFTIVLLSIMLIILLFLYVKVYFSIKYEKRIKEYVLENNENKVSFIDSIFKFGNIVIKVLSKIVNKSAVLKDYSKKISKYIIYFDNKDFKEKEFIGLEIFFMLLVDILYLFSMTIKFLKFNFFLFILVNVLSFFIPLFILMFMYNEKKKLIEEQLLQAVSIMNGSFKSGKNILNSVIMVHSSLPSPIKEEFLIIQKDLEYGLSVEDAFKRFSQRVNLEEAKYITSSLSLLSKTGGNIISIFNMIEKNFYDRLKIKNELEALTSTSKFLYRFLLIIPVVFIISIVMLNQEYFNPLLTTKIGFIIDAIIVLLYLIYIVLIKKVMKVDKV